MARILTIAGSDPSGGAGIQADLRVFNDFGIKGNSVITAITSQTADEFRSLYPIPADIVSQQLLPFSNDIKVDVIKIGIVVTLANIRVISFFLKNNKSVPVVIDPILSSSTKYPLLEKKALPIFEQTLLPMATVITPNIEEAISLSGMGISDLETAKKAAKIIYQTLIKLRPEKDFPLAVIIKGGHLKKRHSDLIYNGKEHRVIDGREIDAEMHGTGCLYSSSLAAELALGKDIEDAARSAKEYVISKLELK